MKNKRVVAVSFLAPALFAAFSGVFNSDRMGIVGIALVLLGGAVWLLFVQPPRSKSAPGSERIEKPPAGPDGLS